MNERTKASGSSQVSVALVLFYSQGSAQAGLTQLYSRFVVDIHFLKLISNVCPEGRVLCATTGPTSMSMLPLERSLP